MANFNGANIIEPDRLDQWMVSLFTLAIVVGPITPVGMGLMFLPAVCILMWRFFRTHGIYPLVRYGKTALGLCLVLLFSWFLFTSFFSIDPSKSFGVTLRTALMITIAVMLFHYCKDRVGLVRKGLMHAVIAYGLWASFAFYCLYIDRSMFADIASILERVILPNVYFKNDAALAVFFLPLTLFLVWTTKKRARYSFIFFTVMILGLVINGEPSVGGNRSAFAGIILAALSTGTLFYLSKLSTKIQKITLVSLLLMAMAGFWLILERLPDTSAVHMDPPARTLPIPDHHRQVIWSFVYDRAMENPLLGVGIDAISHTKNANFKLRFSPNKTKDKNGDIKVSYSWGEYVPSHPHNWILEVASETGAVGIFLLLTALIFLFLTVMKMWKMASINKDVVLPIYFIISGFWVSSLSNFSIWSGWWLISFFVIIALLMSLMVTGIQDTSKRNT